MSKIRLTPNASGTGTVTLTVPSTSTDRTITLPDTTGTLLDSSGVMEDLWTFTTTAAGPSGTLTSFERVSESCFSKIGTGMTLSSGIFTFPSTGIYLILMQISFYFLNPDGLAAFTLQVTQNNSTYDDYVRVDGCSETTTDNLHTSFGQGIVDVTDTSLVKVRFNASNFASDSRLVGNTTLGHTQIYFSRLGDT